MVMDPLLAAELTGAVPSFSSSSSLSRVPGRGGRAARPRPATAEAGSTSAEARLTRGREGAGAALVFGGGGGVGVMGQQRPATSAGRRGGGCSSRGGGGGGGYGRATAAYARLVHSSRRVAAEGVLSGGGALTARLARAREETMDTAEARWRRRSGGSGGGGKGGGMLCRVAGAPCRCAAPEEHVGQSVLSLVRSWVSEDPEPAPDGSERVVFRVVDCRRLGSRYHEKRGSVDRARGRCSLSVRSLGGACGTDGRATGAFLGL